MRTVVSVENLSKAYQLGQIGTGWLVGDLRVWWARKRGRPNPLLRIGQADHGNPHGETIWALRDVSLAVEQGEVLGIIGPNGAGKTTLLKILSRITAPTSGKAKVRGRVASLLEVGTGFHPDLTGRENTYLNGAILGMSRKEVVRKFDEIVDFADVEEFIDTPVKRYSSGMYVRLAFAVAAHLDPEILLVDEVLAVGDAEFQRKCLGKMNDVARHGRTVLFVSHNMAAIRELCTNVALIEHGQLVYRSSAETAISRYLSRRSHVASDDSRSRLVIHDEFITGAGRTDGALLLPENIAPPLEFGLEFEVLAPLDRLEFNLELFSVDGIQILHVRNDHEGISLDPNPGRTRIGIRLAALPLQPDVYNLRFRLVGEYDGLQEIKDSREYPLVVPGRKPGQGKFTAFIRVPHTWAIERQGTGTGPVLFSRA
jgi:ABC-type polysaccharide/polyol phosphate transport system ATPase subunit